MPNAGSLETNFQIDISKNPSNEFGTMHIQLCTPKCALDYRCGECQILHKVVIIWKVSLSRNCSKHVILHSPGWLKHWNSGCVEAMKDVIIIGQEEEAKDKRKKNLFGTTGSGL